MQNKLVDEQALHEIIDKLDLDEHHKEWLSKRWLHYVRWWDARAAESKRRYHLLRIIVIVGGATIPALVSRNPSSPTQSAYLHAITIVVSVFVAIAAGLESLFGFGEIWREKRAAAEMLKVQGWRFFQRIQPYAGKTHIDAYPDFADAVETMIEHEVKDYLLAVQSDKGKGDQENGSAPLPTPQKP